MNISKSHTANDEEKLLIARVMDAARMAEKRNCAVYTDFLSPPQQAIAEKVANIVHNLDFKLWGGYPSAERKMGAFIPKWYEKPSWPITVLEMNTRGEYPAHPEILGALTGLGIRREKLGDILTAVTPPKILCNQAIAPFLIENFTKAGRKAFRLAETDIGTVPEQEGEEKTFTVPSLRLDCIAAEGFGMARTKMTELIKKGGAYLNWTQTYSPASSIKEGDTISLRGHGRIVVAKVGGSSKKDRTFVTVKKYTVRK